MHPKFEIVLVRRNEFNFFSDNRYSFFYVAVLLRVESKKRNIEQSSSQDQEMNCIKLHQLIFSGQLNFLTLQKSLLLHKGLSQ